MGIFIGTINQGKSDVRHSGGSNPDDPRPEPLGRKPAAARHRDWTPHTTRDFLHDLKAGDKGYHYSKSAAGIAELIEEGAGANHVLSRSEADEVAGRIRDDRVALGLTQNEADDLGNMIEAGPSAHP